MSIFNRHPFAPLTIGDLFHAATTSSVGDQRVFFEVRGIGHRAHPCRCRSQPVRQGNQTPAASLPTADVRADGTLRPAFFDGDTDGWSSSLTGSRWAGPIGRRVRRSMTSAEMPSFGQLVRRFKRIGHADAKGYDGDIRALRARCGPCQMGMVKSSRCRHVKGFTRRGSHFPGKSPG